MALKSAVIEACLMEFARLVREDDALTAELEASLATFFRGRVPGPDPATGDVAAAVLAARRHLEWFLLEYHSPVAAGSVAERLDARFDAALEAHRAEDRDEEAEALEAGRAALLRSHTGIFEVEEVLDGGAAWLRDVTGFGSFGLAGFTAPLEGGELIVGRLCPTGEGVHVVSPTIALVRGGEIAKALQRDVEEVRAASSGKVLRVSQGELEAMFFGAGLVPVAEPLAGAGPGEVPEVPLAEPAVGVPLAVPPPPGDPVESAERELREIGFEPERARATIERLAREPRDPGQLVHGGGDVFGRILDEVAFDTGLDLAVTRAALIRAWEWLSPRVEAAPAAPPPKSAEAPPLSDEDAARVAAIDAFAAARAAGGDPGELLNALQEKLGIADPGADEKDQPAPDFPGVVGAMIDEMTWELGATEEGFDPETLRPLRHLATFARPIGVFEELRGDDLFRFATFWLQETGALESDDEARALVAALRRFCDWALDAHEVDLGSEFLDALDGLEQSLPRVRRANLALGDDARTGVEDAGSIGELYRIERLGAAAAAEFESSDDKVSTRGGDILTVIIDDRVRPHLAPGDRVRADIALLGHATIHCCYPPESSALAR